MPTVLEFGKHTFDNSAYLGDSGQRFGDALETSWAINQQVLGYQVPAGKTFTAESLAVWADYRPVSTRGPDNATPLTLTRLGVVTLELDSVTVLETPWYKSSFPGTLTTANPHLHNWSPDCRPVISFDDGIVIPNGSTLAIRFTASQATNPPIRLSVHAATSEGIYHTKATPLENTTAIATLASITASGADMTVYNIFWELNCSYPLLSMLIVRVNGSVWWQGLNIGSPSSTGGTTPSSYFTVPLFSATFHEGDRIVVGAHALLDMGQVITTQLAGTETDVATGSSVFMRRPSGHLRY